MADALCLNPFERDCLLALAAEARLLPDKETMTGLQQVLDCLDEVPAFVVGPRWDILAWNRPAGALAEVRGVEIDPEQTVGY